MSKKAGYFVAFCLIAAAVFAVVIYQDYSETVMIKKIIFGKDYNKYEVKDVKAKIAKLRVKEAEDLIKVYQGKIDQLEDPQSNVDWTRKYLGITAPPRTLNYEKNMTEAVGEGSHTSLVGAQTEEDYTALLNEILKRHYIEETAWGDDELLMKKVSTLLKKEGAELEAEERKILKIKLAVIYKKQRAKFPDVVNIKMILDKLHRTVLQYISPEASIIRDANGSITHGSIKNIALEISKTVDAIRKNETALNDARERRDNIIADEQSRLTKAKLAYTAYISKTEAELKGLKQKQVNLKDKMKKVFIAEDIKLKVLHNKLAEVENIADKIKDKFDTEADMSEDGKILDVNTKLGFVWINLTIKDKILPGMKFKVFSKLKKSAVEKGEIIVKDVGRIQSRCIIHRQLNEKEPFESGWSIVNQIYVKNPSWKFVVLGNDGIRDYTRNNVISYLQKIGHHVDTKGPRKVGPTEGTKTYRNAAKYGITTETQMILLCKGLSEEEETEILEVAKSYSARVIRSNEFINILGLPED